MSKHFHNAFPTTSNIYMKAAGWVPKDEGYTSNPEHQMNLGAVCLFSRNDGGKEESLTIVVA